jgi:deazaflavin-dependent oxidoreductase (nitroreductase family)
MVQISGSLAHQPNPSPVMHWLLQPLVELYRFGFGGFERLFGFKFVFLETVGRRTGRQRRVLVDLVGEDIKRNRYYIAAGWGHRTGWVQNLRASPVINVKIGRQHFRARAVEVTGSEGASRLIQYYKAKNRRRQSSTANYVLGWEKHRGTQREWIQRLESGTPVFALEKLPEPALERLAKS